MKSSWTLTSSMKLLWKQLKHRICLAAVTMSIECWPINGSYHSVAIILPSRLLIKIWVSVVICIWWHANRRNKKIRKEVINKQTTDENRTEQMRTEQNRCVITKNKHGLLLYKKTYTDTLQEQEGTGWKKIILATIFENAKNKTIEMTRIDNRLLALELSVSSTKFS